MVAAQMPYWKALKVLSDGMDGIFGAEAGDEIEAEGEEGE